MPHRVQAPVSCASLGVILVLVLSLAGAGCKDAAGGPLACLTPADCPEDQACFEGYCYQVCGLAVPCPEPLVCASQVCLLPCNLDSNCPGGQVCKLGYCRPGQPDGPDGGDGDGGPVCVDQDQDGFGQGCARGADCDDTDRSVRPGALEICGDGRDNDCDAQTDEADCGCTPGQRAPCYDGPAPTTGVGLCRTGVALCQQDRTFGECTGQILPGVEACNGLDENCDGQSDEGLLNRCGACLPLDPELVELCGNGLDDDCNGQMDENCSCDPQCLCGEPGAGSNCTCHPPIHQPCYSGSPGTLGFGPCRGGFHDCQADPAGGWSWTACAGEVLPTPECVGGGNGLDDDCDGATDDGCLPDGDGDGFAPPEDCDDTNPDVRPGAAEVCNGLDDDCNGVPDDGVTNACGGCGEVPQEICGNGLDEDCDGSPDGACGGCSGSETRPCYRGPPATAGVGQCVFGSQACDGEFWSECQGDVLPELERCDGVDNDCDLEVDERWAMGSNACGYCQATETCDGTDEDCDGLTDEGLRNACGQCLPTGGEVACDGLDDDCDGLVDEGLLTACGTCPAVACYEMGWDDAGDCGADLRDCAGTETDPSDPTAVTLGQGAALTPFIYIAVTQFNTVAKLDTVTGQKIWEAPTYGTWPSRTAVALDYSVWVGNRGFDDTSNGNYSNAAHLDADGNLICRVDAPGLVRGVAIDGGGDVWIGLYYGQAVWKISGSQVDTNQSPPRCVVLAQVPVGVYVYGLAIDGNGYLWTSSSPTAKVDTATATLVETVTNPTHYGIAIDQQNNVWFGGYNGGGDVHRVDGAGAHGIFNTGTYNVTAVTVAPDGYIWGSSYGTNEVVKIDPSSGAVVCRAPTPAGTNPHGVAIDASGRVWVPNRYDGYANRFNPDCTGPDTFEVHAGAELYTYSDMTGMQLRTITTREGHWIQNFDSGYPAPIWVSATWESVEPAGTAVRVTVKSADTEAGLVTAPSALCGPFATSPADFSGCADLQGHRWLSMDVVLSTTQDGVRPSFRNPHVFWSR
ncbi:MAG TPA: MopE-related protein [Myxococcota bacterium]|nr:MopE-related protein [Myxococcota bacterium]HRY91821.1 MopE-related protein [Myxococcota bacterium]HSA21475.1 MopE-related protein [Myxococcota bacterium]